MGIACIAKMVREWLGWLQGGIRGAGRGEHNSGQFYQSAAVAGKCVHQSHKLCRMPCCLVLHLVCRALTEPVTLLLVWHVCRLCI